MRPQHPCGGCGKPTQSRQSLCGQCYYIHRHRKPNPDDALTGGQWVCKNGIQVWEPAPPPKPKHQLPGRCTCGGRLTGRDRYCSEPCRIEARRKTWRNAKRRANAA